jgi:hypothetical protein
MNIFDRIRENLRAVRDGSIVYFEAFDRGAWGRIPDYLVRPYLKSFGLHAGQLRKALSWLKKAASRVPSHQPASEAAWAMYHHCRLRVMEAEATKFLATADLPLGLSPQGLAHEYAKRGFRFPVAMGVWERVRCEEST